MVVQFTVFLTLSTLICRGTDISKCVSESLGIRDNESRLYLSFHRTEGLTVHALCHLRWIFVRNVKPYGLRKIRKTFVDLSSVEFFQRVLRVSVIRSTFYSDLFVSTNCIKHFLSTFKVPREIVPDDILVLLLSLLLLLLFIIIIIRLDISKESSARRFTWNDKPYFLWYLKMSSVVVAIDTLTPLLPDPSRFSLHYETTPIQIYENFTTQNWVLR